MVPLTLKTLFSSSLRVKILSHLFFHPGEAFHVRGLAGEIGAPAGNVARELCRLEDGGIVASIEAGNQKQVHLREDNPITPELRAIFLKTSGAGSELKEALAKTDGIDIAFLHGSYVTGEAHAASDIDLMVIGDVADRNLAPAVAQVERRLNRHVNYTLYTRNEAQGRRGEEGGFLGEVLAGPKLVLIGNANDRLLGAS